MLGPKKRAGLALLCVPFSPCLAQVAWSVARVPEPRLWARMTFDVARGRAVLFGVSANTWEWDGARWHELAPGPVGRSSHGLAYDAARAQTILFGGETIPTTNTTWAWDGTAWSVLSTTNAPPPRRGHFMTYDAQRARVVLFGGASSTTELGDTWEWDGTSWLQRTPAASPLPRTEGGLSYDAQRGVCVLFGGYSGSSGLLDDTWEWNGTNWIARNPATRPTPRDGVAMAFDAARNRTVLFGGLGAGNNADTWEWDGTNWLQVANGPMLARYGAAMTWDPVRNRTLLFGGGAHPGVPLGDAWEWDGASWQQAGSPHPAERTQHAMVHDFVRGETLLFGGEGPTGGTLRGLDDTWTHANGLWSRRTPTAQPTRRGLHALAYDLVRGRAVLFSGGEYFTNPGHGAQQQLVDDTWEWNGLDWSLRTPAVRPPERMAHAMAFAPGNGTVLLFGGFDATGPLQDTWSFDGTNWTSLSPPNRPPARCRHGMATMLSRARVAVFGGTLDALFPFTVLGDLWEWNGTDWLLAAAAGPPARYDAAMTFDDLRERLVVAGGRMLGSPFADTWEWDGTSWSQRAPVGGQPQFVFPVLTYAPPANASLLFDGRATGTYGCVSRAAVTSFGTGCAGPSGTPALQTANGRLPWLGDTVGISASNLPPAGFVVLVIGWSRTQASGLPLPLALAQYGMPGCSLLVSNDVLLPLANSGGQASFAWTVPVASAFLGFELHTQTFATDPAANALGLIASQGLTLRIGGR